MTKVIIKKYRFPDNFDEKIFVLDENSSKKLGKYELIPLGTDYHYSNGETYSSYLHHKSGTSLFIDTEYKEIYLIGLEEAIENAKKDLEKLTGKLGLLEIIEKID